MGRWCFVIGVISPRAGRTFIDGARLEVRGQIAEVRPERFRTQQVIRAVCEQAA